MKSKMDNPSNQNFSPLNLNSPSASKNNFQNNSFTKIAFIIAALLLILLLFLGIYYFYLSKSSISTVKLIPTINKVEPLNAIVYVKNEDPRSPWTLKIAKADLSYKNTLEKISIKSSSLTSQISYVTGRLVFTTDENNGEVAWYINNDVTIKKVAQVSSGPFGLQSPIVLSNSGKYIYFTKAIPKKPEPPLNQNVSVALQKYGIDGSDQGITVQDLWVIKQPSNSVPEITVYWPISTSVDDNDIYFSIYAEKNSQGLFHLNKPEKKVESLNNDVPSLAGGSLGNISPDKQKIVYVDPNTHKVSMFNLQSNQSSNLFTADSMIESPMLSLDNSKLTYNKHRYEAPKIRDYLYVKDLNSNEERFIDVSAQIKIVGWLSNDLLTYTKTSDYSNGRAQVSIVVINIVNNETTIIDQGYYISALGLVRINK